jgi:hypothetical protein
MIKQLSDPHFLRMNTLDRAVKEAIEDISLLRRA